MEGQKVWSNILSGIKLQVSSSIFKTWFLGSYVVDYKQEESERMLVVGVRNNFLKEQVEKRFKEVVEGVAKEKGFSNVNVVFTVSEKETGNGLKSEPLFTGIAQNLFLSTKKRGGLNLSFTFENFVVGPSNNLAFVAASQVGSGLDVAYNPLLIYGPTGVGKTHLLQAIGNDVLAKTIEAKVVYVTAEGFTNDYIDSLRNRTQSLFRNKYRKSDLLVVDDIQFFAGKEGTQDEFFHTFNELALSGKQVVLACDKHPKDLGRLKERLASRFLGGMAVDIGLPDLEMKMAILKAKCHERGIELRDDIAAFMAENCQGGVRELEGVLISVLALLKISGGSFSVEELKKIIGERKKPVTTKPASSSITKAVSRHYNLKKEELEGLSRKARVVLARQVSMFFLRKILNLPLEEIGQILGGRDHSTVIHGIAKVEGIILKNPLKRDEILRIEAAIS